MCVYSMIADHYHDKWKPREIYVQPFVVPPQQPLITQEEIDEFRRLLEKAKEYDTKHNQIDCELDEKKEKIKKLAKKLGVEISFP